MRIIHNHSFADIVYSPQHSRWFLAIYDSNFDVIEYRKYAFRQSAIRYAEKHLN